MNFRANLDGTYDVSFKASELRSIVRMVNQMEQWRIEEAIKTAEAVRLAELEVPQSEEPTDQV